MSYDLTGTIRQIDNEQTFQSGFSKREFVVTTHDKYPQEIKLEFQKDKCGQLNQFRSGDAVTVSFNLRGNEYNGRFYVNLVAWKIEAEGATQPQRQGNPYSQAPASTRQPAAARQTSFYGEQEDDEDIPF
jgi:hypothetical protein